MVNDIVCSSLLLFYSHYYYFFFFSHYFCIEEEQQQQIILSQQQQQILRQTFSKTMMMMMMMKLHCDLLTLLILVVGFFPKPVVGYNDEYYDVIDEIINWNVNISQEDLQSKYCRMSQNSFIFFRGTNHLFWKYYINDTRLNNYGNDINTLTWIQGDLHVENYGSYENDQGLLIYGINDFDDSIIGDYQYDIWRMSISLILWMKNLNEDSVGLQEDVIDSFVESYLDTMSNYRGTSLENSISFTVDNTYGKLDNFLNDVLEKESRIKMLNKWCNSYTSEEGQRQFDLSFIEKLDIAPIEKITEITSEFQSYINTTSLLQDDDDVDDVSSYFHIKDIVKRINSGTGSRGRERYYILIEGLTNDQDDDIILDMKLQFAPTSYWFLDNETTQSNNNYDYDTYFGNNHALRHKIAYESLIDEADNHLGWMYLSSSDGYFSIRERSPFKETYDPLDNNSGITNNGDYIELAEQWGMILATSHARSDQDRSGSGQQYITKSVDKQIDIKTNGHHIDFRSIVKEIAIEYSSIVETDWMIFKNQLMPDNCV